MQFDLKRVDAFRLKLASRLLDVDVPLLMDEEVTIELKASVSEVQMKINRNTGQMMRTHVLTVESLNLKEKS